MKCAGSFGSFSIVISSLDLSCVNNLRQLPLAAHLYGTDFRDEIIPNLLGDTNAWIGGAPVTQ